MESGLTNPPALIGTGAAKGVTSAEVLHGRTSHQALELGKAFVALLSGATEPSSQDTALECLRPLAGMPVRARCILLHWRALEEALGQIQAADHS